MFGKLDEVKFGAIIRHILRSARGGGNHTWFVEKDDFATGTFSDGDWEQLLRDVARMAIRHHRANLSHLIEIPSLDWRDSPDYAAAFYGDFLLLFDLLPSIVPFDDEADDMPASPRRAYRRRLIVPHAALMLTYR